MKKDVFDRKSYKKGGLRRETILIICIFTIFLVSPVFSQIEEKIPGLEARKQISKLGVSYSKKSFFQAAVKGNEKLVKLFLKTGIKPNVQGTAGITPLIWTAIGGNVKTAGVLIRRGANINETTDEGLTALTVACGKGYLPLVKTLIQNNADPDITDSKGWTPLMHAAAAGNKRTVKYLIQTGAKPDGIGTLSGFNALDLARMNNHTEIVNILSSIEEFE